MDIKKLNEQLKNISNINLLEKTDSKNIEDIINNTVAKYLKDYSIKKDKNKFIITANVNDLWQESRGTVIGSRIFNALDKIKDIVSLDGWDSRDSNTDKESLIIEVESNVNDELDNISVKKLNEKLNLILNKEEITFGKWQLNQELCYLYLEIDCPEYMFDNKPEMVIGAPQDDGTIYYYILDEDGDEFYEEIDFPKPDQKLIDKCLELCNKKSNESLKEQKQEITFSKWQLDKEDGYLYLDIYCPKNIYNPIPTLVVGVPQDNDTISYYIVDEYNDTFFGKIDFPKPDQSLIDQCLKLHKKYDEIIDTTGREDWPDTHPDKYIDLGKVEKYKEVSNFDTMLKRDGYEIIGKVETGKFYYKRFKVIMNNVKLEVKCFPKFYDSQQFIHFSTYPNQSYWFNYAKLERESIPKYLKRIEQKMLEFSEKIYNRRNNLRNKRINKEI